MHESRYGRQQSQLCFSVKYSLLEYHFLMFSSIFHISVCWPSSDSFPEVSHIYDVVFVLCRSYVIFMTFPMKYLHFLGMNSVLNFNFYNYEILIIIYPGKALRLRSNKIYLTDINENC